MHHQCDPKTEIIITVINKALRNCLSKGWGIDSRTRELAWLAGAESLV